MMDDQLLSLLEYADVLGALVATRDGLVIGTAGLDGDDAEVVAAAGSMLLGTANGDGPVAATTEVGGGALHVQWRDEVALVVLTERDASGEGVQAAMEPVMESVVANFAE